MDNLILRGVLVGFCLQKADNNAGLSEYLTDLIKIVIERK